MPVYAPNPETPTARHELLAKLIRRALDPGSPEPEAVNCAARFVSVARTDRITFDSFCGAIAPALPPPAPAKPAKRRTPPACKIVIAQGKHAGETLRKIARTDLQYLRWVAQEWRDEDLREAAEIVLNYYTSEGAK